MPLIRPADRSRSKSMSSWMGEKSVGRIYNTMKPDGFGLRTPFPFLLLLTTVSPSHWRRVIVDTIAIACTVLTW